MRGKMKPSPWKARRRGEIYCSPACGANCTWAEYQAALRRARSICRQMGKGWKPVVHENLGWHAKAISPCKRITVTMDKRIWKYRCSAGLGKPGEMHSVWHVSMRNPKEAVNTVIKKAKTTIRNMNAIIAGL